MSGHRLYTAWQRVPSELVEVVRSARRRRTRQVVVAPRQLPGLVWRPDSMLERIEGFIWPRRWARLLLALLFLLLPAALVFALVFFGRRR